VWVLTRRERFGALVVDALELEEHTHLMHHYQGSMVGGSPHFREMDWLHRVGIFILHF